MRLIRSFIVLLLVLLCAPVWAQAQDEEAEGGDLPPVTVTARRLNESTDDPPAFVEVIEMDDYAGRLVSTDEVLRRAAGVNVTRLGGLGATATVSIRGAASRQVVVLVDGVRLNTAAGGGVDLGAIPPAQIERIEVIRGGDSAYYGEGAIGGVINIVTRRPDDAARHTAAVTHGSFNTWRLAASRGDGGERWRTFVSGSYLHSDGDYRFTNNRGTELDDRDDFQDVRVNNELDQRSLLVKVAGDPNDALSLAAQNDLYSSDAGVPGMITFPSPHVHERLLRDIASAAAAWTGLGLPGLSLRTRLANRYERSRYRDEYGEQTGVPFVSERVELEPQIEPSLQYVWGAHQLWTLDGLARHTRLDDEMFDDPTRETYAVALRDQVLLWSGRVTLVGALRYDDVSDAGDQFSPKGGLALKPWTWLTLKGNVGRSFRAPSFSELYFQHGYVEGNPDLKPERAMHLDAGMQTLFPWLSFEGAYFRSEVRDLIEYVLVGGFRYKPFNIGRARLEGMELSAQLSPADWLTASGAYTLTYAVDENAGDDRQIPGRPRHTAAARLEARADIFAPFVEYDYADGNYLTAANTKMLDERHVLNAGLVILPTAQTRLGVEMKNVTDERIVDVRNFPLPGRAMYLTFERSF